MAKQKSVTLYHPTQRGGEITIRGLAIPGLHPSEPLELQVAADGAVTVPPKAHHVADEIARLAGLTDRKPSQEVTENAGG